MHRFGFIFCFLAGACFTACLRAQSDDSSARPPVTTADAVVRRAAQILDSAAKWNHADNRICPPAAGAVSIA